MKVQILSLREVADYNASFRASDHRMTRDDFERAEMAERGTALFFWQPGYGIRGGFSWQCPGCATWHFGPLGDEPVSGWDNPVWVNSGTRESPTLTPSLGCPGWRHGTCPEGHYWLRDGELVPA
jgi:hypothetical protein